MPEITMPQLGETVTEGTITKWLKQVGDHVDEDEVIYEVSTDKVDSEVPSPVAGYLTEIKVPEGETVEVGAVLAVVSDAPPTGGAGDGGASAAAGADGASGAAGVQAGEPAPPARPENTTPTVAPSEGAPQPAPATEAAGPAGAGPEDQEAASQAAPAP